LTLTVLGFIACTAAIFWAGTRLTTYADVIAGKTRLGRVWAGMLLLAVATSLPELINSTSAAVIDLPDLAAGDIAGSNLLNLVIIGVVGVFTRSNTCFHNLSRFHTRSAVLVIIMSVLAATAVLLGPALPALGWISVVTPPLLVLYLLAVRRAESKNTDHAPTPEPTAPSSVSLRTAIVRYLLFALVVIGAAMLLPGLAGRIAESTGLGNTFIGTTLVAFATSLPELVTAAAAIRIGAAEMAVAGILGSNLFNLATLGIVDVVYWRGNLFAAVQTTHTAPLVGGILLAGLLIVMLRTCPRRRFLRINWFGWVALAVYVANTFYLYLVR
jgi:cation:H+ antiporter